jgi:hypothetical protein
MGMMVVTMETLIVECDNGRNEKWWKLKKFSYPSI